MAMREYWWNKLLAMALKSDLMNTLLSGQAVPQIYRKGIWGTSLDPMRVRTYQFKFALSQLWLNVTLLKIAFWHSLWLNATLAFWKWNTNVTFWHCLWLNMTRVLKVKCESCVLALSLAERECHALEKLEAEHGYRVLVQRCAICFLATAASERKYRVSVTSVSECQHCVWCILHCLQFLFADGELDDGQ